MLSEKSQNVHGQENDKKVSGSKSEKAFSIRAASGNRGAILQT
jgi:hypothetical protein